MNTKTLFIGIGTGLIAGAAAVLFTTPKSGNDVKLSLKERKAATLDLKDDFQQRFQEIKTSIDAIKAEVKETVPSVVEDLKESVTQFQEDSSANQEKLQEHITELQKIATDITTEVETLQKR